MTKLLSLSSPALCQCLSLWLRANYSKKWVDKKFNKLSLLLSTLIKHDPSDGCTVNLSITL